MIITYLITRCHLDNPVKLDESIVNIYDMVWKLSVLGDCVPCAGSRLKNPLSFYCLTNLVPRACDPWEGNEGSGIIRFREESDWPLK